MEEEEARALGYEGEGEEKTYGVGDEPCGEDPTPPPAIVVALDVFLHGDNADEEHEDLPGEEADGWDGQDHPASLAGWRQLGDQGDRDWERDTNCDADHETRGVNGGEVGGQR